MALASGATEPGKKSEVKGKHGVLPKAADECCVRQQLVQGTYKAASIFMYGETLLTLRERTRRGFERKRLQDALHVDTVAVMPATPWPAWLLLIKCVLRLGMEHVFSELC